MEHKSIMLRDCELKFAQTDGAFSGYASIFGNRDFKNDIVMPGAFSTVLKSGDPVQVYVNHGWLRDELPVGLWTDLKEDQKGLFGDASLVMQMPSAVDAYWAMKSGLVTGLSIGFLPDLDMTEYKSDGSRVIHGVKLLKEISIVTDPANDATRVVSVKFKNELSQCESEADFENLLRAAGLGVMESKSIVVRAKSIFAGQALEQKSMESSILERIRQMSQ